jgi:ubiquinone/menaquinone biosynthesis C-methylase UbiE
MKADLKVLFILVTIALSSVVIKAQENDEPDDNKANQLMFQNSIESLVESFDSPDRAHWQKPDDVIALFGEVKGKKIMDLGAGSGYFTLRLAAKGANVIAADVNNSFQEIIREKLEKDELKVLSDKIELRKVPYDHPGLTKEEVDGILLVNTWHHINDRRNYLKKTLPGLKGKGRIIIVDFKLGVSGGPPDSHKLGLDEAMGEIKDLDFSEIKIDTTLLPRQYIIICQK